MFVFSITLILNEIKGFVYFPDIVVITAHLGQQRVGIDFRGSGFNHGTDDDRMMIGAGGFQHELSKNRLFQVCQGELVKNSVLNTPSENSVL